MATQVQFRRGTTAQNASFTGALGEVTVDTDKDTLVVHDGGTAGGFEISRADASNLKFPDGAVGTPAISFASDTNTGIYRGGTDILKFVTAGTDAITINASQNVGIGTSSPTFSAGGGVHNKGSSGAFTSYRASVDSNTGIDFAQGSDGKGYIYNRDNADLIIATNNTERMRITSAGLVGIGTSSIDTTTQISKSTTSTDGSVYPTLKIENTSAGSGNSYARFQVNGGNGTTGFTLLVDGRSSNSDVSLRTTTNTPMSFYTNGSERMRITSGGDVLVGTNSNTLNSLHFVHSSGGQHAMGSRVGTNGNFALGVLNSSGTVVGGVVANASSTAYNTSSDHRLKENVTADWEATTRLKQLNPVRFNFIADADTTVDGFLAHEVQSVVPEAINGIHNEVDADGNPVYQGIDQSKLVPLLVKTIQELEARIVALETA